MSILGRVKDFLLFRDLPANRAPEVRELGGAVVAWQAGKPQWGPRNVATYIDQFYSLNATIYACVIARALAVSTAPLRVYQELDGQQDLYEKQRGRQHPFRDLISHPNPETSEAEFWTLVSIIADVTNLCVIEKVRGRPLFPGDPGRITELWPLRTDWIKPIPRNFAPPDWQYTIPGHPAKILKAEDAIVYSPSPSPTMDATGFGPISVVFREASIHNAMTDFLKAFFDNGGMPAYGLIPRANPVTGKVDMKQAEADVLREAWRQRFAGASGMADIAVMVGIEDVKRIGFDFNELAYTDLRDVTELDICKAFGVPPGLVGVAAGLERNTFTNFAESRSDFYERTIAGLWARLDGAFTRGLLPEFETDPSISVEFDTSAVAALQEDEGPKWERATAGRWFLTVADARREVGLPDLPGTDFFLRTIADVEVPAQVNGNGSRATVVEGEWRRILPQDERKALSGGLYRLPPEQRATAAQSAKQTIVRLGDNFAPSLQAFWREQGQRVIGAATRTARYSILHKTEGDEPRIVGFGDAATYTESRDIAEIAWDDEERQLREVLQKLHVAAGESAATAVGTLTGRVGFSFDLANPWVRQVLDQLAGRVVGINDTTRQDVQRIVGDALNEGVSLDDLGKRLTGLFEESYRSRAYTVGRTESQVAYNSASVAGYRETGVVGMAELADSSTHCEDYGASDGLSCCDRNGLLVELDNVERHIAAEHPNGSLAVLPVLSTPLGEV